MNYQEIEKTANDRANGVQYSEKRQRGSKEEKHVAIVHGVQNNIKMPAANVKKTDIRIEEVPYEVEEKVRSPIQCMAKPGSKMR